VAYQIADERCPSISSSAKSAGDDCLDRIAKLKEGGDAEQRNCSGNHFGIAGEELRQRFGNEKEGRARDAHEPSAPNNAENACSARQTRFACTNGVSHANGSGSAHSKRNTKRHARNRKSNLMRCTRHRTETPCGDADNCEDANLGQQL
tara:strand:+ start:265 stop:711 length:447 start_codon:yes stop_codon:yes gene_type:complete